MMIFLIEYDRRRGELITFRSFADSERRNAEEARLDMELKLHRVGTEHEVVILEAATEEALRRTHRRYFESLSELVNSPA
ncbi:MAG TPA: hypothetical protein VEZ40_09230 [Pyrinomonadaceae bacterium]|nr:hypothetical protein [Pyrinomonadaceae bacterium]